VVRRTTINDWTNPSSFLADGGQGGLNISDVGTAGNTISFTVTIGAPIPPTLVSPANAASMENTSVQFVWEKCEPAVNGYWLEQSTDSLFAHSVVDSTLNDTSNIVQLLPGGTTLWWHVRARNSAGWGPFSETRKFSVNVTDVEEDRTGSATAFALEQNYPNPFNPTTEIQYTIPVGTSRQAGTVSLRVYDMLGREVATLVNETQPAGHYTIQFHAGGLASGVYFYRLKAGGLVSTRRFLLLK
jgi:hypothetical protein